MNDIIQNETMNQNISNGKNNKKLPIIISIIVLSILLIVICIFGFGNQKGKEDPNIIYSNNLKVLSKNEQEKVEWGKHDTIIVDSGEIDAVAYSFDGGINWQTSNEYIVTKNGKFNIIIKDKNGKQTQAFSYNVNTIDNTAPVITVALPAEIELNNQINLSEYVKATDDISGIEGKISINPTFLDTSAIGTKIVTYTVKDKAGNLTSINVSVNIVEKVEITTPETENNNETEGSTNTNDETQNKNEQNTTERNVTLYRYRVKKSNSYVCKQYDCSFYSDSDTVAKYKTYVETGKCNKSYDIEMNFRNGCYITPPAKDQSCTQSLTTKNRYSLHNDNYIDIIALLKDGTQATNKSNNNTSKEDYNNPDSDSDADLGTKDLINATEYADIYKAAPCGTNEIELNGYCHAICSKPTYTCPSGYKLIDGKCKKYVSKTCSDKCTNYSWSNWSTWSESKIIATEEIQVETKVVKK